MSGARWKFWGWGREDEAATDAETGRAAAFYRHLGADLEQRATVPEVAEVELGPPRVGVPASLEAIASSDPYDRLLHTYGKSFPETVKSFRRDFANAPDLVLHPQSEAEVAATLDWASDARAAVIPFGGGSSVVGGVEPVVEGDFRGTVSLDLKRLDQVVEVDRTSRAARIQGGVVGPALEAALKPDGLTLRHFPQSFSYSTLGGWIATRSGGHYATLLTHIDDMVESVRAVTPAGVLESRRLPGSGAGPSPDRLIIGSEGALGVITEAWMRLQDRPRHRTDAAVAFPGLFEAARAIRAVSQAGLYPSNLRVLDPNEARINGAGDGSSALLVLAFESADHPVDAWQARALELVQDHGGRVQPDASAAQAWRTAFIRMPYLREWLVPRGVLNDTFETAITWDRFEPFHDLVKSRVESAVREATGRDGVITCRFTHVYPDGPAPYFTIHAVGDWPRLLDQWAEVKRAASDAVIEGGGTITHHHAVGRDHMPWYVRQRPELFGVALRAAKHALDPTGILNPGVLVPEETLPG